MRRSSATGFDFAALAPAGYYIALRLGFAFPMEERNQLPSEWVARYTTGGLMLVDPVLKWVFRNHGVVRWSEIDLPDPAGVLSLAANHGLQFGATVSCADYGPSAQRTYGSFARRDREFTDTELTMLSVEVERLHENSAPPTNLTQAELEALRMVRDGLLMKEIAGLLGVSEGAVQQRLKNAKLKLNASTSSQAVAMATGFGLI
jgi:LuxR family transcriptional regulator